MRLAALDILFRGPVSTSWHIWNEGMRLEALSLKLMELTVLHRQEFPLQELPGEELLADVAESLSPIFQDKGIEFHLRTEQDSCGSIFR